MPAQYNEWDSQGMSETFTNAQLWEHVHIQTFMDEKEKQDAIKKRKLELWKKACEIIEEVLEEAHKAFENPNPRDVGVCIAELLRPVIEEYKKI